VLDSAGHDAMINYFSAALQISPKVPINKSTVENSILKDQTIVKAIKTDVQIVP
jgi:hypothetical protein